jgi:hypothetical protein
MELENLIEINKFLDTYDLPKLNLKGKKQKRTITNNHTKTVISQ